MCLQVPCRLAYSSSRTFTRISWRPSLEVLQRRLTPYPTTISSWLWDSLRFDPLSMKIHRDNLPCIFVNFNYIPPHACVPVKSMDMSLANKVSDVFSYWNFTSWQNACSGWCFQGKSYSTTVTNDIALMCQSPGFLNFVIGHCLVHCNTFGSIPELYPYMPGELFTLDLRL